MQMLTWTAYGCWAAAAVVLAYGASEGALVAVAAAISGAICGAVLLGFSRAIDLLREIRDSVSVGATPQGAEVAKGDVTPRSIDEISADLDRLRKGAVR